MLKQRKHCKTKTSFSCQVLTSHTMAGERERKRGGASGSGARLFRDQSTPAKQLSDAIHKWVKSIERRLKLKLNMKFDTISMAR